LIRPATNQTLFSTEDKYKDKSQYKYTLFTVTQNKLQKQPYLLSYDLKGIEKEKSTLRSQKERKENEGKEMKRKIKHCVCDEAKT
jgi:hypothetical protein